ncbi:MAG TPA: sialidase family protein [Burkholderiaceae bacterium]|nr:sialidase family protein [Burkholderiaceae bacterium]
MEQILKKWSCVGAALLLAPAQPHAADASFPVAWQSTVELAAGRGERGPWRQNDSRYDYVDDPTVALDARGDVFVAWVDQARKDVLLVRVPAGAAAARGAPVNVSRSPATFSWLPRIALAAAAPQKVFVLWQEIIFSGGSHGGDILFARSDDGGKTFAPPLNLSISIGGDGKGRINREIWDNGSSDIVAAADGATIYVAWTEYDGPLWLSRSSDGGRTFAPPWQIQRGKGAPPARAPSLALAPDGTLYLAWTVGENEKADIQVASSADGGASFSTSSAVAPSRNYADAPALAVDHRGTVHLAYAQSSGGPFARYDIRYTRSTDRARTFEQAREISRPAPKGFRSAAFPALAVDARGNVYASWDLFTDRRGQPQATGFAVSRDAGTRFTTPMLVPGSGAAGATNGSHQGLLMRKLAVNDAGAVALVNSSLKAGERSRVWLLRASVTR